MEVEAEASPLELKHVVGAILPEVRVKAKALPMKLELEPELEMSDEL